MITLHRALYAYLSLYMPLRALIAQRIYPSVAPQETTFPYLTVQRLGVATPYHMGGASATHNTLVQIDCWALSAMQAQQVAAVVRQALDAYPEPSDEPSMDDLEIDGLFIDSELDDAERADDGSERTYYRTVLTVDTWHAYELPAR